MCVLISRIYVFQWTARWCLGVGVQLVWLVCGKRDAVLRKMRRSFFFIYSLFEWMGLLNLCVFVCQLKVYYGLCVDSRKKKTEKNKTSESDFSFDFTLKPWLAHVNTYNSFMQINRMCVYWTKSNKMLRIQPNRCHIDQSANIHTICVCAPRSILTMNVLFWTIFSFRFSVFETAIKSADGEFAASSARACVFHFFLSYFVFGRICFPRFNLIFFSIVFHSCPFSLLCCCQLVCVWWTLNVKAFWINHKSTTK